MGWDALMPKDRVELVPVPGHGATMLIEPNVEALGRAISRSMARAENNISILPKSDESPVVTIARGQHGRTPIVCIPGAGGNVTAFAEFADALASSSPIEGLQPRGLDGETAPHSTVRAAANYYLRAIREKYPEGPLHLVGHSFGGWVAFEMALLLSKTAYPVSSLTIIDSQAPDDNALQIRDYTSAEAMARLASLLSNYVDDLFDFDLDQLELLDDTSRLKLFHSALVRANLLPHRSDFKALEGMVRTFEAALRTSYQPSSALLGPSYLALARDSNHLDMNNELRLKINANRWRRWLPNLIVRKAPGDHMTMLKSPHVQVLGKWMQGYLSDSFLLEEVRD